ncbi:uncharacterized protein LOC129753087 [Uranotaenia lowii]|uniref:uncharacterized protein LOC129753087 n=1 Tax=Uranotaenia lowii TaxID=190385 RepID=UPI002478AFA4|nr:uncharacterized protein LOC129753087 [Uranotaenia lowii]
MLILIFMVLVLTDNSVIANSHSNRSIGSGQYSRTKRGSIPYVSVPFHGCRITLDDEDFRKALILEKVNGKYFFKKPKKGLFEWRYGEQIFFSCDRKTKSAECVQSTDIWKSKIECEISAYLETKESVSEMFGTNYDIGFEIDQIKKDFLPLYSVRYDKQECSTTYSVHALNGAYFGPGDAKRLEKQAFSNFACKGHTGEIDNLYKKDNQNNFLPEMDKDKYPLHRGHLTPDQDMPVYLWKRSTYTFANIVPIFNTINSEGNWHKLECLTKALVTARKMECTIFTGGLNVPELPKHFLTGTKISIPHWLWKVVKCGNAGFVAFVRNLPKEEDGLVNLCKTDQLKVIGFEGLYTSTADHGFIHFCKYTDVKSGLLPSAARFTTLLKYDLVNSEIPTC